MFPKFICPTNSYMFCATLLVKIISETVSASNPRNILPDKFEFADTFNLPLEAGRKYTLSLRVRKIYKVLKAFRFASKNLDKIGALILGDISF